MAHHSSTLHQEPDGVDPHATSNDGSITSRRTLKKGIQVLCSHACWEISTSKYDVEESCRDYGAEVVVDRSKIWELLGCFFHACFDNIAFAC
jgi:hypothetical protein